MLPIAISMKSFFLDHTRTKLNNLRNHIEYCVNRIKLYMEQYFGYQLLEKSGIYISAHRIKNDSLCVKKQQGTTWFQPQLEAIGRQAYSVELIFK